MPSLTAHLLSIPTTQKYSAAVNHPFLHAAGSQTVSNDLLSFWLSQDRIYAAHAYPRFIGLLITKVPFSSHHRINSPEETRNQRILATLVFSLQNVSREALFFSEVSEKWNLDLDAWKERPATRAYTAEMARVASLGTLEEGLVFLWAMEKVYLDAWRFVASGPSHSSNTPSDSPAPVTSLVQNWTSPDFAAFVHELGVIVDELAIEPGSEAWTRAEMIWDRVVELEEGFWPDIGEEKKESSRKA